jgi:hypothetical protein
MSNTNPLPPSGKAPMIAGPSDINGDRRVGGTNIVSIQPPKQSDLQVRLPLLYLRLISRTRLIV